MTRIRSLSPLYIFRHSRISFLLRSSRPRFLARGTLCLSSSISVLSFCRRMARRRPDPSAYQSESKRRSWPKRDGRCFAPSLLFSLSLSCCVPYEREKRTEIEDGGSEREMDKRMVLILEPLALPSRLIPAPFHYRDEPQSFVRGFRPFFLFLSSPRRFRALSLLALFSFPRTIIGRWRITNSGRCHRNPFANMTQVNLELEICHPVYSPSFTRDTFFSPLLGLDQ